MFVKRKDAIQSYAYFVMQVKTEQMKKFQLHLQTRGINSFTKKGERYMLHDMNS
jgi:hypothetical protein